MLTVLEAGRAVLGAGPRPGSWAQASPRRAGIRKGPSSSFDKDINSIMWVPPPNCEFWGDTNVQLIMFIEGEL